MVCSRCYETQGCKVRYGLFAASLLFFYEWLMSTTEQDHMGRNGKCGLQEWTFLFAHEQFKRIWGMRRKGGISSFFSSGWTSIVRQWQREGQNQPPRGLVPLAMQYRQSLILHNSGSFQNPENSYKVVKKSYHCSVVHSWKLLLIQLELGFNHQSKTQHINVTLV